ncbi:MAG: hypothetical protein ABWZ98_10815 [Nakamurella sp.]
MTTASTTNPPREFSLSAVAFRHDYPVAGWATLLAPGVLAGVAVAAVSGPSRPGLLRLAAGAAGGLLVGALLARITDEVRWRRTAVSLRVDEPDVALDLMQAVRAEGVQAEMVRAMEPAGPERGSFALRYRAKDDRRVRAVLAEQQG